MQGWLKTIAGIALITATPVLADSPTPIPTGQLDNTATPSAYRLDLTLDPASPRFSGHVEIDATLNRAGNSLFLHGRDLAVRKAEAVVGGKSVTAQYKELDPSGVAQLTFAEALPAGPVTLKFDYDGAFADVPSGLFRVKVGDAWYSWSQFESIDARAAYPSFDQPGYKQPFTVTLRTPPGLMAVSNAPEIGKTLEGGLDVHRFAPTAPLPTYLVAMMVGPFASVESVVPPSPQRATPLPLRIISTQQNKDKLAFALENSKQIVAHLEDYFGTPFPYPKLDQITAPIMPGAMENAGADLYQDNLLVLGDAATTGQKRSFGMVVSHELSHQWFGDLVTPQWWDDIWLNESFANWMGFRIGQAWRPDLNIGAGALAEGFGAMGTDALLAGRPIQQAITHNNQIDAAFDAITYGKGGHVVAMMASFIGDAKFRDGVRRYMAAHRYGNASSADFYAAMADAAGDPRILPAMQSFTRQQGVPLLNFTGSEGKYTVRQSRYARFGTTPPPTQWVVPLCLRRNNSRQCQLLDGKSAEITIGGSGPLIPNAGGTGYYRFELPRADWDQLIAQSDTLPSGEALALADSLRASFIAGRAEASQLADLARVMGHNPDSHASAAAMNGLDMLAASGMLNKQATVAYRHLVGDLFRPQLAEFGFDAKLKAYASEAPVRSQRRAQIVGRMVDNAQDAALRKTLLDAATAWLGGDSAALDPQWYGLALGLHVEKGGMAAAKALFDRALASQDPLFRPAALAALGDSDNSAVARWLLDGPADKRLRPNERLGILRGIIGTGRTSDFGFRWLLAHLDEMTKSGGIFFASRLPQMLVGFCSVSRAEQFATVLRPRMKGQSGALELERTIERVRACGMLKAAKGKQVSQQIAG